MNLALDSDCQCCQNKQRRAGMKRYPGQIRQPSYSYYPGKKKKDRGKTLTPNKSTHIIYETFQVKF